MTLSISPAHEKRLLDWLEQNEVARDVIFFCPPRGRRRRVGHGVIHKSKSEHCLEAVRHIFSLDGGAKTHMFLQSSLERASLTIRTQVNDWKTRYQHINAIIGKDLSDQEYEQIKSGLGKNALVLFNKEIADFPIWKNLHVYWKDSPRYNQFCPGAENEQKDNECITINHSRKELTAKRRKSNAQKKINLQGLSKEKDYIDVDAFKSEDSLDAKLSQVTPTDARTDLLTNSQEGGSMTSKGPMPPSTVIWSTEQLHQLEMAKLEIEKLDKENRRLELEASNQRAKERHEDRMLRRKMLMKLVNENDSSEEA